MAKKVPLEIKSDALRHYLNTKCTLRALQKYTETKHGYEVSQPAILKWIKQQDDILGTQKCVGKVHKY